MKLNKVLDSVNQIEKSSFLKILDGLCVEFKKTIPEIDKILSEGEGQLKNVDNNNIVKLFELLKYKYSECLQTKIKYSDYQLDIMVDILTRDGNAIMSREWFLGLYNKEISKLKSNIQNFSTLLIKEKDGIDPIRKRDYLIFQKCVKTGYENDLHINRDKNLSWEEKTLLYTLAKSLELSNDEVRWITYSVLPLKKHNVDDILYSLKESGLIFFNRRTNNIFVPDEIVWLLREFSGIEVSNKNSRRILRNLSDKEINLVARKHNIDKKLGRAEKINEILMQGLSVSNLLTNEIFKPDTNISERKKRIQTLISNELDITLPKSGVSLENKISNLIRYLNDTERDETISLSRDGYQRLLIELKSVYPKINKILKEEFELQPDDVMEPELLVDYNIKPRDVINLFSRDEIRAFCKSKGIKTRGNLVSNIIEKYRNIEDLYLENFELVGQRDLKSLHDMGLTVKESELGLLYEQLTKKIFKEIGFNVDEGLKKQINTKHSKMDILLNLGEKKLIIVECKTLKDKDYDKYASVSRQLKSYQKMCQSKGYEVSQALIMASDFSEDFISECEYDIEISLSLITSSGLIKILQGFNNSRLSEFPVRLFLKDGLLNADRIVKALSR